MALVVTFCLSILFGSSSYGQTEIDKYIVQKDKNGKPLPICVGNQVSTNEKPCRIMTNSQRAGAGSRS